jgi:hypothetical protein
MDKKGVLMKALGYIFVVLKWIFGQRKCLGRCACCAVSFGGAISAILGFLGIILFLLYKRVEVDGE